MSFASSVLLALAAPVAITSPTASTYADRITVSATGSGPDVLLIPGLASSARVWDATVEQLAPKHRVHVVQVAGFAGAPAAANASGPVLTPVVEAIHAYIASHRMSHVAVIGHSLGGLIGMRLALDHPDDVGRLMLVDALPFYGMVMGPQATVAAVRPQAAAMRDRVFAGTQEEFAASEPAAMARLVKSNGPAAQAAVAAASASDHHVVAQAMYDDLTTDLRPEVHRLARPVTLLYPWDPSVGVPETAWNALYRSALAAAPYAEARRIDGSYHFIMIDQPVAFAAAVTAFVDR